MRARTDVVIGGVAFGLYLINRFALHHVPIPFLHYHFDDLLAPFLLLSFAGLWSMTDRRICDALHGFVGAMSLMAACSFVWEVLAPQFVPHSVGDPLDALCYMAGGLGWWAIHRAVATRKAVSNGLATAWE